MAEREYPRWVHSAGHKSVVAKTAEEEASIIAGWASKPPVVGTFTSDDIARAYADGIQAALTAAQACGVKGETIAAIHTVIDGGTPPERKPRGWPKGKPRPKKTAEVM